MVNVKTESIQEIKITTDSSDFTTVEDNITQIQKASVSKKTRLKIYAKNIDLSETQIANIKGKNIQMLFIGKSGIKYFGDTTQYDGSYEANTPKVNYSYEILSESKIDEAQNNTGVSIIKGGVSHGVNITSSGLIVLSSNNEGTIIFNSGSLLISTKINIGIIKVSGISVSETFSSIIKSEGKKSDYIFISRDDAGITYSFV